MRSQQEISGNFLSIVGGPEVILPAVVKQRDSLQRWIQRKDKELDGSLIDGRKAGHPALAARANRRGYRMSAGYLDNLASGKAANPSVELVEGIAAAYAVPLMDVITVAFDLPPEGDERSGLAKDLIEKYKALSPAKQREKQPLMEMVIRELQR